MSPSAIIAIIVIVGRSIITSNSNSNSANWLQWQCHPILEEELGILVVGCGFEGCVGISWKIICLERCTIDSVPVRTKTTTLRMVQETCSTTKLNSYIGRLQTRERIQRKSNFVQICSNCINQRKEGYFSQPRNALSQSRPTVAATVI